MAKIWILVKETPPVLADYELTGNACLASLSLAMAVYEYSKGRIFDEPRFPMTFKECLRRIIGGRSYGNRLHLFRRFWSAMLNESSEYKTEADRLNGAGEQIAYFKLNHVSEGEFGDIARNFFKWRKERDRQQRTNAVKSRWQKQKLVRGKKPKK